MRSTLKGELSPEKADLVRLIDRAEVLAGEWHEAYGSGLNLIQALKKASGARLPMQYNRLITYRRAVSDLKPELVTSMTKEVKELIATLTRRLTEHLGGSAPPGFTYDCDDLA